MIVWLLVQNAVSGEIRVPDALDAHTWAAGWADVCEALEDPELDRATVRWTRSAEAGWTLTLEHDGQIVEITGIEPAAQPDRQREQLYALVALRGARRAAPPLAIAPLPRAPVDPVPGPAPVSSPEPDPQETSAPPADPWLDPDDVSAVLEEPVPEAPRVRRPRSLGRFSFPAPPPRAPLAALIARVDNRESIGLTGQLVRDTAPLTVGARFTVSRDGDVVTRDAELPAVLDVVEQRAELMAVAEGWPGSHAPVGVQLGLAWRGLAVDQGRTVGAVLPVIGAHAAVESAIGAKLRIRSEVGFSQDLRQVVVQPPVGQPARLPTGRVWLAIGLASGGAR